MDAGYRILLNHVSEARSPKSRRPISTCAPCFPLPEDIQLSEDDIFGLDTEVKLDHESPIADNVEGEAGPRKEIVRALLLPLIILLLLVPGFLLFVEHVRRGNYPTERTSWMDQDPSIMSRDGEKPQAAIDAAGLDPLQPVNAWEKHENKVERCDGWRDRIDVYVGGWKGCTM